MSKRRISPDASPRAGRAWRLAGIVLPLALVIAACGGGAAEPADGETIQLRYSGIFGKDAGLQRQLDWYMDEVEERTDGRVEFERFYDSSLLGATDTLAGLVEGRAETAYMVPAYAPADMPLWNASFVPVAGTNAESVTRSQAEMNQSNEAFQQELENAGIKMLVFNVVPSITSVWAPDPITGVEQLDGMSVRSLGYLSQALELRGVNPVVLEAPETYESIQRGVVDGAGGFAIDVLTDQGLHEVAPWGLYMGFGEWVGAGFAMSVEEWEALPADIQEIMLEVTDDFYDEAIKIAEDAEASACDAVLEAGGGVTTLPDDQVQAWVDDIGDSLWEAWRSDAASSGASEEDIASVEEDYRALNEQFAAESTYTPGAETCVERTELP
ncbi:MAG: hypothetical protein GEU93_04840 [Propionibacteriales bacterium]|nr:hypothetical protein [Propionibacteriales bacterium]